MRLAIIVAAAMILGVGCAKRVVTETNLMKVESTTTNDMPRLPEGEEEDVRDTQAGHSWQHVFRTAVDQVKVHEDLGMEARAFGWSPAFRMNAGSENTSVFQRGSDGFGEQLQILTKTYSDGTPTAVTVTRFRFLPDFVSYPRGYLASYIVDSSGNPFVTASYTSDDSRDVVVDWYKKELSGNDWVNTEEGVTVTSKKTVASSSFTFFARFPEQTSSSKFTWGVGFMKE